MSEICEQERSADTKSKSTRSTRLAAIALCVGLSAIAVVPFFFMGRYSDGKRDWRLRMPYTHDMFLHYDQMRSFFVGLKAGDLYPRWEADTNHGFGAPTMIFYPPGVYYVTSAFHLLTSNWYLTLLLSHLAIMIASAAALYFYARRSLSRTSSTLAMALYIVLPYHLTDQYQREALAELLGFVWMPLLLLSLDSLFVERVRPRFRPDSEVPGTGKTKSRPAALSVIFFGLSYAAFVWSHPPTAYQFGLILAILIPLLALMRRDFKGLILSGAGVALALGLSAAYLYPAFIERNLVQSKFIAENWPYHESYVFMRTQYMLDHWDFFSLIEKAWVLNLGIVIAGLAVVVVGTKSAGALDRRVRQHITLWVAAAFVSSIMMTRISYPVSRRIPMIDIGVFSWRMLAITTLTGALMVGAAMDRVIAASRSGRKLLTGVLAAAVSAVIAVSLLLTIAKVIVPAYAEDVFVPETEHINYAMMPAAVDQDPEDLPADDPAELDEGNGIAVVRSWEPEHRLIHVELTSPDSLWIRTFDYPGWTVRLDGKPAAIVRDSDFDEIVIDLPSGAHEVAIDFTNTRDRRIGVCVALGCLLVVVFVTVAVVAHRTIKVQKAVSCGLSESQKICPDHKDS